LGFRVFDVGSLVQDDRTKMKGPVGIDIAPEQGVTGQHQIVLGDQFKSGGAVRSIDRKYFQFRSKMLGFAPPIEKQGGRADDQRRTLCCS
jgi:hypothetical protein